MRVWDRKIEDKKRGWGEEGQPHVPRLIALIFLSPIFLSRMRVVSIQYPGFSGPQNGGNASFGCRPDQHGLNQCSRSAPAELLRKLENACEKGASF